MKTLNVYFLESKGKTKVAIGRVKIIDPKNIVLKEGGIFKEYNSVELPSGRKSSDQELYNFYKKYSNPQERRTVLTSNIIAPRVIYYEE